VRIDRLVPSSGGELCWRSQLRPAKKAGLTPTTSLEEACGGDGLKPIGKDACQDSHARREGLIVGWLMRIHPALSCGLERRRGHHEALTPTTLIQQDDRIFVARSSGHGGECHLPGPCCQGSTANVLAPGGDEL